GTCTWKARSGAARPPRPRPRRPNVARTQGGARASADPPQSEVKAFVREVRDLERRDLPEGVAEEDEALVGVHAVEESIVGEVSDPSVQLLIARLADQAASVAHDHHLDRLARAGTTDVRPCNSAEQGVIRRSNGRIDTSADRPEHVERRPDGAVAAHVGEQDERQVALRVAGVPCVEPVRTGPAARPRAIPAVAPATTMAIPTT